MSSLLLQLHALQEVDHLSREELVRLVKSLNGEDTSFDAGQDLPPQEDTDATAAEEPITIAIEDTTELLQPMDVQTPAAATETPAATSSEQSGGAEAPTAEQETLLTDFIGITGAEVDAARHALEVSCRQISPFLSRPLSVFFVLVPKCASSGMVGNGMGPAERPYPILGVRALRAVPGSPNRRSRSVHVTLLPIF